MDRKRCGCFVSGAAALVVQKPTGLSSASAVCPAVPKKAGKPSGKSFHVSASADAADADKPKRRRPCFQCNGTGNIDCINCDGDGTVPGNLGFSDGDATLCPACDGKGFEPCDVCNGTGVNGFMDD
eukprot:tig00021293_g20002.t1